MVLDPSSPVGDGTVKMVEKPTGEPERETWGKKIEFLLAVVGFAVDLGNVWRFPYICYRNGGGAFLIPYLIMLIFGGLPLFYMELALGQFQRCGCLTLWNRICPMFKGIGLAICIISTYVSWYYNTIIAWSVYIFFSSMRSRVPWLDCGHSWNTNSCYSFNTEHSNMNNTSIAIDWSNTSHQSPAEEFFELEVLGLDNANGIGDVGGIKWSLTICLSGVFVIVYFAMWKGVKSSGKAVWITATMPYVVLIILLIRGCTLPGSWGGIKYYLSPDFSLLASHEIWVEAAAQIFFSLGPGFGVLLALSSYNKFTNNCYKDALVTSCINCCTSFIAGFAVFSVLGHMAYNQEKEVKDVAREDVGLIFYRLSGSYRIIIREGSTFWALLFFFMLITLGLDTTFGGLEAICTGILDEWPWLRKRRELFVLGLMAYCFLGALATTTYGGIYVVQLLDNYGAPVAIIFVVFLEAAAVSWIYGIERFSKDIESMIGHKPGIFWRFCWGVVSPVFLLTLFILSVVFPQTPKYGSYVYPPWSLNLGWVIVCSSLFFIPAYMVYKFIITPGNPLERLRAMTIPEEVPKHAQEVIPVYL
ncbi:hypothetical protein ScPMuIL_005764 [Solemya velum]